MKEEIKKMMEALISEQQAKLMKCGAAFVSNLTTDDLLQPNDFPELENNPHFRYEEGVLEGLMTARAALLYFFSN